MKKTYPRDGWNGKAFRRARRESGRSPEWVAVRTGVTAQTVVSYELDRRFPSHRWRDDAALALGLDRAVFGLPQAATR